MAKYFFCNKFVNEMFLGCNIKNLFGSREARILYYASVCFRHGYCTVSYTHLTLPTNSLV